MADELDPSARAFELLDLAACGLLRTTDDGTFLRVNQTFCNCIAQPADELVGRRRFQDLLTVGGRIFHQTHWAPLLRMQGSVSEVKLDVMHRDGSTIPMVLNAIRREQGGEMVHDIAAYVARDRDKYERELVQSRKRLEAAIAESTRLRDEAKDRALFAEQMIGIVSHDMRNPLSAIAMGAAVLTSGELSAGQQRVISRIARATDRANRLIADLLDFTQARLGEGIAITPEPIDLHAVIGEAVDELTSIAPGRALRHERSGEGTCSADANRLAQLVGNLVSNAITYGAPEVPVTVRSAIGVSSCSIAVHNGGVPIPEEARARLFEPMTRGTHTSSGLRSVGLGLYIVRQIAKAHGGHTRVESSAADGTTFTVELPRSGGSRGASDA
ncbi:MAG TPA: PAS domain-containing sensor histidine kinase [Polyangiales bacterium]|nr:PAS domain-containing sensor histidine kinase [Polyangiales bacterium]